MASEHGPTIHCGCHATLLILGPRQQPDNHSGSLFQFQRSFLENHRTPQRPQELLHLPPAGSSLLRLAPLRKNPHGHHSTRPPRKSAAFASCSARDHDEHSMFPQAATLATPQTAATTRTEATLSNDYRRPNVTFGSLRWSATARKNARFPEVCHCNCKGLQFQLHSHIEAIQREQSITLLQLHD